MGNQPSSEAESGRGSGRSAHHHHGPIHTHTGGGYPNAQQTTSDGQRSYGAPPPSTISQEGHPHITGGTGGYIAPGTAHTTSPGNHPRNYGVHKSTSDTSMHDEKHERQNHNHLRFQGINNYHSGSDSHLDSHLAKLSAADDDVVPTVFRWEHGGRDVYITGTFNGWTRQIPMHRSGNDFTYIHNLKRGKHAFKFIVDDEWRFAPDQPTVADIEGRINNFIDVTDFKPYTGDKSFEQEKNAAHYSKRQSVSNHRDAHNGQNLPGEDDPMNIDHTRKMDDPDGEVFTLNMPDLDDYTKDPPPLPPHLRHIILNKPPQLQDTAALPVPQHVALNHLYCTAIRDNMMVLGITQRFKTKFVTTVYYSPELSRT